jgi:hypothetical protein
MHQSCTKYVLCSQQHSSICIIYRPFSALPCQNIGLGSILLPPDHEAISNIDDIFDFDQLSEQLIAGAVSANVDRDVVCDDDNYDSELPAPPLRITIPPLNSATLDSHRATPMKKT